MLKPDIPCEPVGLGESSFSLAVYIANRPPLPEYHALTNMRPLINGEIYSIAQQTGNHWRKIFNVYAKFLEALNWTNSDGDWRRYRDLFLLQEGVQEALLFSEPNFNTPIIHIIAGKTYAAELNMPFTLDWQDEFFAVNRDERVIVCPYFDYRQLSNERIGQLVNYVQVMS